MKQSLWLIGLAAALFSALLLFLTLPSSPDGRYDTTVQIFYPERTGEVPPFSQREIHRLVDAARRHGRVLERVTVFAEAADDDPTTSRKRMDCGLQLHTRNGCTITLPSVTAPCAEMIPRLTTEIDAAVKRFEDMGLAARPPASETTPKTAPQADPE